MKWLTVVFGLAAVLGATFTEARVLTGISDFAPSFAEEESILACLRGRHVHSGYEATCRRMLDVAHNMDAAHRNNRNKRGAENLDEKYHLDMNRMMLDNVGISYDNSSHDTEEEVRMNLASCSSFSQTAFQDWQQLYNLHLGESDVRMLTMFPQIQSLADDVAEVTINTNIMEDFQGHELLAADLALERIPPSDIEEFFGKYTVEVEQVLEGETNVQLYSREQASCATTEGNMMVASLTNTDYLTEWFLHQNEPMKLIVRVRPNLQLFADASETTTTVNILRKVLSLSLLLRPTVPNVSSLDIVELENELREELRADASREKRSNRRCRLTTYSVNFHQRALQVKFGVVEPQFIDIKRCIGPNCNPVPFNVDHTNHANAMQKEIDGNPNNRGIPSVQCVPSAWRDVSYSYRRGGSQRLLTGVLHQVAATRCGCM